MARTTKTIKTTRTRTPKVELPVEAQPQPETPAVVAVEESEAKKQFRAFIEKYKAQDPAKFASKEQELLNKLNKL